MQRIAAPLALFLIAPFVAEFLLGNLSIDMLPALVVLAPFYGGGALIVREAARRTGRGWPTVLVLGIAFGVVEEAFLTQSLFNPDYLGLKLHLLQPAYVRILGIGLWWTVYVLTLHAVWSVAVSIALAEALFPRHATTPWLRWPALALSAALYVFGSVATAVITYRADPFVAPLPQLAGAIVVTIALLFAAFRLRRPRPTTAAGAAPRWWLVGLVGLAAGSAFLIVPPAWGGWAVAAYLAVDAAVVAAVLRWSRHASWNGGHVLALAGGAALAYAWHAFPLQPAVGTRGTVDLVGNTVFALLLVGLLAAGARRRRAR